MASGVLAWGSFVIVMRSAACRGGTQESDSYKQRKFADYAVNGGSLWGLRPFLM